MSLQIFIRVMLFISAVTLSSLAGADWNVDFSRRSEQFGKTDTWGKPAVDNSVKDKNVFEKIFDTSIPLHEVVILNTDTGFIPSSISVAEGHQYKVHVVNVNEKSKNVSFVLDAFSEHHATYYGKIKTFYIHPKKAGVYTFQSPETSAQGRLVVYPPKGVSEGPDVRLPASED